MEELVSVVMPTYKRSFSFIKNSIESVLNQTYINLELIIVDDNPIGNLQKKDIELEIKNIKDSRIKFIQHKDNKGACIARNTGINVAKGKYIAFLDDDDEWLPLKLEKQLQKFTNSQIGLVYSPYYVVSQGEKRLKQSLKRGKVFKDLLKLNFIGSTSCVIIRKDVFLNTDLFDENLPASQDYDLYLRISSKYLIEVVEEPLIIYNIHEGERISGDPYKKLKARKYIYDKFKYEIKKHPRINSLKKLYLAQSYAKLNNKRKKWRYLFTSFFICPIPTKKSIKLTIKILQNK